MAETVREWQPIETAREDGTPILVYRAGRQYVAQWHNTWRTWGVSAERVPGEGDHPFTDIDDIKNLVGQIMFCGPTHWMPLPEPPAPPSNEGGT